MSPLCISFCTLLVQWLLSTRNGTAFRFIWRHQQTIPLPPSGTSLILKIRSEIVPVIGESRDYSRQWADQ
jgi:hypothetical protein